MNSGDESLSAACKKGAKDGIRYECVYVCINAVLFKFNEPNFTQCNVAKARNSFPNITKVFFFLTLTHTLDDWLLHCVFRVKLLPIQFDAES